MKKKRIRTGARGAVVIPYAKAVKLGLRGLSPEASAKIERFEEAHARALQRLKTHPVLMD